ncbi:DUF58 domain-containing protein [Promicromonospora citrea]|uniref:DUF58 domain-containing protein n=1 Tax=Promicromonospora citrea TaxID=43677 RepID=A0A8H9L501_9MICO|nr:DUF58 domain-containing protein [Promicromonospora citrea]NNH54328.1 DUF58 domain-containing protein [Promicromonospora citrea]GGM29133.1 hypothetical protein GCM10010102_26150 [Promicromonospora citrea]
MTGAPSPGARRFRRLELTVRRRVDGLLQGDVDGDALGPGTDPEELTPYRPGGDVRRIDWNVTARTGSAHVWRTRAQHELDTWVLVDRSPSMAFGTALTEKVDVAQEVAAAVGLLTAGPGNRVGVGLADAAGLHWLPPRPGLAAAALLTRLEPAARAGDAAVPLADALRGLGVRARRRGLCVVVSDLVVPDGRVERPFDWEEPLRRLTARHDVIVVEVDDPRERELPDVGEVVLVDPETGAQREISTSDPELRLAYAVAAARHRDQTAAAVRAARAEHVRVGTDEDWATALARFVRQRRRTPARRPRRTR